MRGDSGLGEPVNGGGGKRWLDSARKRHQQGLQVHGVWSMREMGVQDFGLSSGKDGYGLDFDRTDSESDFLHVRLIEMLTHHPCENVDEPLAVSLDLVGEVRVEICKLGQSWKVTDGL